MVALRLCMAIVFGLMAAPAFSGEEIPLRGEDGRPSDPLIETLLAPGEFPDRRISHISEGDEALYCLDSSLGAATPFVQVYPERIHLPSVGGVSIRVEHVERKLKPVGDWVNDAILEEGFAIRWIFKPIGLRFDNGPEFALSATAAEVFSTRDARVLMAWEDPPPVPVCTKPASDAEPQCNLAGISREVRSVAVSPEGVYAALGISGIKPRLELYEVGGEPRLLWQSLFPAESGGVVEVGFSADGGFVTALLGDGAIHRFSIAGGRHMVIPSMGRTARGVPPGDMVLVGGRDGKVTLWRLSDGTIEWQLPARNARGSVDRLAVSGDGRRIATLEYDNGLAVVRVWDLGRRTMMLQLSLPDDHIADMAFDFEGQRLYLAHEKDGLMMAPVEKGATPGRFGVGVGGGRCRSTITWIEARHRLGCSVEGGVLEFNGEGQPVGTLTTLIATDNWRIAVSAGGTRTVAVSDGHLLSW